MHTSHFHRWHFSVDDVVWPVMALLGVLGMVALEAVATRLMVGKW